MLVPLDIPPGVYRNGTEFQQNGRWRDASLVRWHEGSMRPVGGWRQRGSVDITGTPRGMISWQDNTGSNYYAMGTKDGLFVGNSADTITDITPGTFTSGRLDADTNTGFGGSTYGSSEYGVERPSDGERLDATVWTLDTWGEYLVAISPDDGRLLEWQLDTGVNAAAITNAPTNCKALFVTEERFLFALAADGNPRLVQWSDREDNTTWTPAETNEAGDIELQTNGEVMCGVRTRGQSLILTDQDAHTATYVGPPFVYGFERVGSSCGVIGRQAAAAVDEGVFWMGAGSFYRFSGGAVEKLPCDVSDYIFSDFNVVQRSKVFAVKNSEWDEIWWFYPSSSSTEINRYVSLNYKTGYWMTGNLERTAGVDDDVFDYPLWFDADGVLYEHEVGFVHGGLTPYAETGPVSIGVGENIISAVHLYPDEGTQGQVSATFKTRFYPNGTEYEHGPYSPANPTSVRFTGRQIRMRIEQDQETEADWRVGVMRLDVRERGTR